MLQKFSQIVRKLQAVVGTAETLADADCLANASEHNHLYDVAAIDRGLTLGTLTAQEQLAGTRMMEVHFTTELVGGAASTPAPWHTDLKCAGFQESALKVASIGSYTDGPFVVGELVGNHASQASATKTARVVHVGISGKLVFMPILSTFVNTDVMYSYGASVGASVTLSSTLSNAGYSFRPLTETDSAAPATATVQRFLGGELHTAIDAYNRATLMMNLNMPAKLRCEYRGIPDLELSSDTNPGRPRTGSRRTVTAVGATPTACKGMPIKLNTQGTAYAPPVLTKFELDLGNVIADRPTITDQAVLESGNLGPRISGREFSLALDPDYVAGAGFDFIAKNVNGSTFEAFGSVGKTTDTNGMVALFAPKAQIVGQQQLGDREGVATIEPRLKLAGQSDDELYIWHVFAS